MIIKNEFLKKNVNYTNYKDEQNIVADYNGDQTKKINYIKNYFKEDTKNILDIGCRDGKFIKMYNKKYKVYGIDIGDNARIRAEKTFGKKFASDFITIIDVQDESFKKIYDFKFNFINFSHVIEHLIYPKKAIDNIKFYMTNKTEMLIIIPADLPRFKTIKKCIEGQPYHEIFWENKRDIINFLDDCGLDIIKIDEILIGSTNGEWRCLVKKKSDIILKNSNIDQNIELFSFNKKKKYHNEIHVPMNIYGVNINIFKNFSMLGEPRIINLINLCKKNKINSGVALECGVANGGSLQIMRKFLHPDIIIYGLDSFSHMPKLTNKDENELRALKLNFNKKNGKLVGKIFGNKEKCIYGFKKNNISLKNLYLIKGYFNDSIPKNIDKFNNIVILRLDADWYEATYFLLDTLYDKVVKGGIVIIDDFYAYIGCRKAVIDFFNNRKLKLPFIYHTKESGLKTITGGTEVFWYK